jgi:hypothetical protein
MKVGSPEWERDDLLRQVSNNLYLRVNVINAEIEQQEKELRTLVERKTLIQDDIQRIARVRWELFSVNEV